MKSPGRLRRGRAQRGEEGDVADEQRLGQVAAALQADLLARVKALGLAHIGQRPPERPAAVGQGDLEAAEAVSLGVVSIAALLISGYAMLFLRFGGFAGAAPHINVMQLTGIAMILLFLHLFFAPWRRFSRAVETGALQDAGAALNQIVASWRSIWCSVCWTVAVGASGRFWARACRPGSRRVKAWNPSLGSSRAYLVICAFAYFGNRQFMYFPDPPRIPPAEAGLDGVEEIELAAADAATLVAWHAPPKDGKPTLLYFHGNAANAANRAPKIE